MKARKRPTSDKPRVPATKGTVITKPAVSIEKLAEAYERLGSVWLVAEELSLTGQGVQARLRKAGIPTKKRWVTQEEKDAIRRYYENTPAEQFSLQELSDALGRTRHFICRLAGDMGLSKPSRPASLAAKLSARKPKWQDKPHPRGMAGKKHKPEVLALLGQQSRTRWATDKAFGIGLYSPENRQRFSDSTSARMAQQAGNLTYHRAAAGVRADIGTMYFRSRWEANYARYLNLLIKLGVVVKWDFEQETFWFEAIKRGVRSYKPDFRVWYKGDTEPVRVEIKGWVKDTDRTKWSRMRKYHPHIRLEVVGEKDYKSIARKFASSIPNWETERRGRAVVVPGVAA